MNATTLPRHIAIIMDGNGRWAKAQRLPRIAGHKVGAEVVREIVKKCAEKRIEILTLFAFSSENWQRPLQEVSFLMDLFITLLKREIKKLHAQNVRVRIIGDRTKFNAKLREQMSIAEAYTANNTGLTLVIAANYGGRWDLCETMRSIALDVEQGKLTSQDITPALIQQRIALGDFPEPDLLIRTSGEQRISNFLLWQLAYTELYFTNVFWPDFNGDELEKALDHFATRERRFGKTEVTPALVTE